MKEINKTNDYHNKLDRVLTDINLVYTYILLSLVALIYTPLAGIINIMPILSFLSYFKTDKKSFYISLLPIAICVNSYIVALYLVILGAIIFFTKKPKVKNDVLFWILVAVIFSKGITILYSTYPIDTIIETGRWIAYLGFYIIISDKTAEDNLKKGLNLSVLITGLILCFDNIMYGVGINLGISGIITLPQVNFSTLFALILPIYLFICSDLKVKNSKFYALLYAILGLVGITFVGARGPLAMLIVCWVVSIFIIVIRNFSKKNLLIGIMMLVFLTLALLPSDLFANDNGTLIQKEESINNNGTLIQKEESINNLKTIISHENYSNNIRINMYADIYECVIEQPLGYGAGTFANQYENMKTIEFEPAHAHNTILQIWFEEGLIGLFIMLIWYGYFFAIGLKNLTRKPQNYGYLMILTAYVAYGMVEGLSTAISVNLIFIFITSRMYSLNKKEKIKYERVN